MDFLISLFFLSENFQIFGIQKNKISTKELSNFFRYGDKFSNKIYNFINKNILNKIVYNESPHDFDEKYLKINKNAYLYGQWGSYKYFESIADIIKEEFTIILKNEIVIEHLLDDIKNNNSVCLNVRRADFVNNISIKKLIILFIIFFLMILNGVKIIFLF